MEGQIKGRETKKMLEYLKISHLKKFLAQIKQLNKLIKLVIFVIFESSCDLCQLPWQIK